MFSTGDRPLFIRFMLAVAERLEARARTRGTTAAELVRRIIREDLDGCE
jgi:predicted DNA-binding protein